METLQKPPATLALSYLSGLAAVIALLHVSIMMIVISLVPAAQTIMRFDAHGTATLNTSAGHLVLGSSDKLTFAPPNAHPAAMFKCTTTVNETMRRSLVTPNFAEAIKECSHENALLVLPQGDFVVEQPIIIGSNTTILGYGTTLRYGLAAGYGSMIEILPGSVGVFITGLRLEGPPTENKTAIHAGSVRAVYVSDGQFFNWHIGIAIDSVAQEVTIDHNFFMQRGVGDVAVSISAVPTITSKHNKLWLSKTSITTEAHDNRDTLKLVPETSCCNSDGSVQSVEACVNVSCTPRRH